MASSLFNPLKQSLDQFDYSQIDRLFVENRLRLWFDVQKKDGSKFNKLKDFFQDNYIEIQIKAFFWGLDTVPDVLTFEWMNKLHELSVNTLLHENGSSISHKVRAHRSQLGFPGGCGPLLLGLPIKASPAGIDSLGKELIDKNDEETGEKVCFFVSQLKKNTKSNTSDILIVDANIARKYYEQQQELFDANKDILQKWCDEAHIQPAIMFASPRELDKPDIEKSLNAVAKKILHSGFSPLLEGVGYVLLNRNPFVIREKAERIIKNYNESLRETENEKIDATIHFVKGLLNLHVWDDGNGRLCAHHLLNILLIKNGLCPAFLNNNCLDAFTHEELKDRIIKGMQVFKSKCGSESGQLKKFRDENNLPFNHVSDFVYAIINNKMDSAKTAFAKLSEIPLEDLNFFINYKQSRIDWICPQNLSDYFYNTLLFKCIESANKPLLLNLLQHCVKQRISLYDATLAECLCFFDLEMFKLFIQYADSHMLETSKYKIIWDGIPHYRYTEVALQAIHYCFSGSIFNVKITGKFIQDVFEYQQPTIIFNLMEQPTIKKLGISSNTKLIQKIAPILMERCDLFYDEKSMLLNTVSPDLKLNDIDPLADFNPSSKSNSLNSIL